VRRFARNRANRNTRNTCDCRPGSASDETRAEGVTGGTYIYHIAYLGFSRPFPGQRKQGIKSRGGGDSRSSISALAHTVGIRRSRPHSPSCITTPAHVSLAPKSHCYILTLAGRARWSSRISSTQTPHVTRGNGLCRGLIGWVRTFRGGYPM